MFYMESFSIHKNGLCFDKLKHKAYLLLWVVLLLILFLPTCSALSVVSSSPAQGTLLVGRQITQVILTFDASACFVPAIGYVSLRKVGDPSVDIYLSPAGDNQTTIYFNSAGGYTLEANADYYINIHPDMYRDCSNPSSKVPATQIHFMTGACLGTGTCCYNPPSCLGPCFGNFSSVKHLSPPNNGHFMQAYEGLNIIFNGNVALGAGNITIRRYSDDAIFEIIDVNSNRISGWGTNSITIDPIANLASNTRYYVNFDIEGYSQTADKNKWNFWTKSSPNTFSAL